MNIVQAIKQSVADATGMTLYYGSEDELNVKMDYAQYPCAYGVAIDGSTINTDGGVLHDQPTIVVAFVNLANSEDAEDIEELIEARKQDAFKWISALQRNEKLQLVSINQAGRLYKAMDAIICGYSVNITLRELVGVVQCPKTGV